MYNVNKRKILDYKSTVYISKKLDTIQDENLMQIEVYDKPVKYRFNVQTVNSDSEIREFGELASSMKVMFIDNIDKYRDKFVEFDKVYLNTNPEKEIVNGYNADYRIYSVRPQNLGLRIYIIKIVK